MHHKAGRPHVGPDLVGKIQHILAIGLVSLKAPNGAKNLHTTISWSSQYEHSLQPPAGHGGRSWPGSSSPWCTAPI